MSTYKLTKKDGFQLSHGAKEAFQQLKQVMAPPQVLALPDFTLRFELEYDASGNGIVAVLQQKRPIAFTSQDLGPRNQSLSCERELIAIVHAVKKWQNYLQGCHFMIKPTIIVSSICSITGHTLYSAKIGGKTIGVRL